MPWNLSVIYRWFLHVDSPSTTRYDLLLSCSHDSFVIYLALLRRPTDCTARRHVVTIICTDRTLLPTPLLQMAIDYHAVVLSTVKHLHVILCGGGGHKRCIHKFIFCSFTTINDFKRVTWSTLTFDIPVNMIIFKQDMDQVNKINQQVHVRPPVFFSAQVIIYLYFHHIKVLKAFPDKQTPTLSLGVRPKA